jgi:hypothetical protein
VNASANPPTVNITSPSNNETFAALSTITIQASANPASGTVTLVEFFNGATKLGEDSSNPYSFDWNNVPAGSYTLRARVTNSMGASNNSSNVNVLVTVASNPPTIQITSPSNGAVLTAGTPVTLQANASDINGTVAIVEFFRDGIKLGEDLSSPYQFTWNNPPIGTFLISAKATDNSGSASTDEIQVFVNSENGLPVANAGNDLTVQLPVSDLIVNGNGDDSDGVITAYEWTQVSGPESVDFTQDAFGQLVVSIATEGIYVFELKVTDNGNSVGTDELVIRVITSLLRLEHIPRYFTPNNDGENDIWEWRGIELFANSALIIFNRFGMKVFETSSYDND